MIIAIRISGLVEVPNSVDATLFRIRLRRKYSAVLLPDNKITASLLKKVRDFVAYGKIDEETLSLLLSKRASPILKGKKLDYEKITSALLKQESSNSFDFESLGIKPFFRLHSPRGGIESKVHFPIRKGVLGDNKDKINDLIRRML